MHIKNIVVGLLLNTITVSQAADASIAGLKETDIAKLYSDHYQTKEKMISLYSKFNLGKDQKLTKEQQNIMKPISSLFEELDQKVKALHNQQEIEEEKAAQEVIKAPETAVALPKETPQGEPEVSKKSEAPVSAAAVPVPDVEAKKEEVQKEVKVEKIEKEDTPAVEKKEPEAAVVPELKNEKTLTKLQTAPVKEDTKIKEAEEVDKKKDVDSQEDKVEKSATKAEEVEKVDKTEKTEEVPVAAKSLDEVVQENKTDKEVAALDDLDNEAQAEPVPEAAKGKGVIGSMFDYMTGSDSTNKETKEEEEDYFDEIEKAQKQDEVKESEIMDGQLDETKDTKIEEDSEIKSDLTDVKKLDIDDKKELVQTSSDEAPKDVVKAPLNGNNSTLADKESEELDQIADASPDLTIAFLILVGLGISVFYNQSQQDQGASQFTYKETNNLATKKGDEASLFSSWHADPNIGNRQRSHNLLQCADEEINF